MDGLLKKPQTNKGRETLNNILSAATQLIYERGYYGANVADITKLAGVATGTFYVYFDSKLSLYRFLLLHFSHQIRMELAKKTAGCRDRREVERVGMQVWLEYIMDHPYFYNVIWESLYVDRSLFIEYYENFCRAYSRGLDAAKDAGEVAEIDSAVLAFSLMGMTTFLGLRCCMPALQEHEPAFIVDEAMKLLEHGMFAEKCCEAVVCHRTVQPRSKGIRVEVDFDLLEDKNDE